MQVISQKPKTINQELFLWNIAKVIDLKINDKLEGAQLAIITDSSLLGYREKNQLSKTKSINIEGIPKLSTIGLYKKGQYRKDLSNPIGYISNYPLNGRQYLIDTLYDYHNKGLRVIGKYAISIPNYVGGCSFDDAMDFAVSSDQILDFDGDMVYEYILNGCNIVQKGKIVKSVVKDTIFNELNYISYFMESIKFIDQDIFKKCESFLNEEIRNLR